MYSQLGVLFLLVMQFNASNISCQNANKDGVSNSINSMEELLQVERNAVFYLEDYIKKLHHKTENIKSLLEMLRKENEKSMSEGDAYLSSRWNVFSSIHRQYYDWYDWDKFLQQPVGGAEIGNLKHWLAEMPNSMEFTEAVEGIRRLHLFNNISANDMTNGVLNGRRYDARFSAFDAVAIARTMFDRSHYKEANEWIEEALRLFEESPLNDIFESNRRDLYALYAEIQLKLGNGAESLEAMNNALTLDPFNAKLYQRRNEMELENYVHFQYSDDEQVEDEDEVYNDIAMFSAESCQEKFHLKMTNLSCRFYNEGNAFLKWAPFKVEELSLNPYVVKFYDIISDEEIAHLKEISRGKLHRAKIFFNNSGFVAPYRTVKNLFLPDNMTKIVSNVNERLSDMTGLDLKNSELLQMMNYGLAGHYLFHHDYIDLKRYPLSENFGVVGDRIATVLIYMSDVIDGGETVFPEIEIAARPQKGTALFWYNLDDRGDPVELSGHIACPVVVGSKWAATKWIVETNQFRTRPCLAHNE